MKAFVTACAAGDVDAAERLLADGDGGIDLCARGLSGATAAHAAAQSGSLPLLELLHRHAAAADGALRIGVHADAQRKRVWAATDFGGSTPFLETARKGHTACVEFLAATGAVDVQAVDKQGWTAAHCASTGGHLATVQLLVEKLGVDRAAKDADGQTALDWARAGDRAEVVAYLESASDRGGATSTKTLTDEGANVVTVATANNATAAAPVEPSRTPEAPPAFAVGQHVEARPGGGRSKWYKGVVAAVNDNGTYKIEYADGDRERRVKPEHMRAFDMGGRGPAAAAAAAKQAAAPAAAEEEQAAAAAPSRSGGPKKADRMPAKKDPNAPPFFPYSGMADERDAISEIVPGALWLTNWRGAEKKDALLALGVKQIVKVCADADDAFAHPDAFTYLLIDDVTDDEEMAGKLQEKFERCSAFIEAGGPTAVHCAAGISRSATLVLAHLMRAQAAGAEGVDLRRAFERVYAARRVIWPNNGFMATLIAYEAKLRAAAAGTFDPALVELKRGGHSETDEGEYYESTTSTLLYDGNSIWSMCTKWSSNIGGAYGKDHTATLSDDKHTLTLVVSEVGGTVGSGGRSETAQEPVVIDVVAKALNVPAGSIEIEEYKRWGEYSGEDYAAARVVDR